MGMSTTELLRQCARRRSQFFDDPTAGSKLQKAIVLNEGPQRFLNKCAKVERLSRRVTSLATATPLHGDDEADHARQFDKAIVEATARVASIINRSAGKKVQDDMCVLIFDVNAFDSRCGEVWTRADKFDAGKIACVQLLECWKRLDFNIEQQPKFEVLVVCTPAEYDASAVETGLAPLRQKREKCPKCVDNVFTGRSLDRLAGPNARRHYRVYQRLVPILPVCSSIVERKHLLGQEAHGGKKRGRHGTAGALAQRTYRKMALMCTRTKQDLALDGVLGVMGKGEGKGIRAKGARAAMFRQLMSLRWRARGDRREGQRARPRSFRARSGFGVFRMDKWTAGVRPGSPEFAAEQRRITQLWNALSDADKAQWDLQVSQQDPADAGAWARRRDRKRKAFEDFDRALNHGARRGGAQTDVFGCALKPNLLDVTLSAAAIEKKN